MKPDKFTLISIALIVILGFAVYANSLSGEFIWDDNTLVKNNLYIRSWTNIAKIFTEDVGAGAEKSYRFWRPMQMLTYMLDYSFWELNPLGYHLTNIVLHILAALTLFWLINLLYDNRHLALITGLFFTVHPIHTEAVSYISGRTDPLALLFLLLCFIFYIKALPAHKISFYILALFTYVLALLSRESSLILPVLLLLYHYSFKVKLKIRAFLPLLALAFAYIILRLTLLRFLLLGVDLAYSKVTLLQRLPGFFVAIFNYLKLLLVPFNQHMEYGKIVFPFGYYRAVWGIIIILFLLICALSSRKTNSLVFFSLFWFFIALLPSSNLYPINAYMAEHWLYLPSIGFFLILANVLSRLYQSKRFKSIAIALIIFLLGFYAFLTVKQNNYWRQPLTFYQRTLKYAPFSAKMHVNLGIHYDDMGESEKSVPLYQKAIQIDPKYDKAYYNLGNAYYHLGQEEKAISPYKKAIELNPVYYRAYNNLGLVYRGRDRHQEAIELFIKAIAVDPSHLEAYNNLGLAYKDIGSYEQAIEQFKKALLIAPGRIEPIVNLAAVYLRMGRDEEGIALLQKAIKMKPDCAQAYYSLAKVFFRKQQYKEAIEACDKARALGTKANAEFLKALEPYRQ